MNTTPYRWINSHLKNLVQAAPTSPYTRALLRIKFNSPVPDECQTFEQIESWLATISDNFAATQQEINREWHNRQQEINRGEYRTIRGHIEGYEIRKEYYRKSYQVKVPRSLFTSENHDEILEWVYSEVVESSPYYYDSDYLQGGEETDRFIDENLDDLIDEETQTTLQ